MSRNKAKGTRWEVSVRDYLNADGVPWEVYRPAQEGFKDTGDLHGLPYFAVQCKDWRDVTSAVREGTEGVQKQKAHYGRPLGVNVVKRARANVSRAYAVLTLEDFRTLVAALSRADVLLAETDTSVTELIEEVKRA